MKKKILLLISILALSLVSLPLIACGEEEKRTPINVTIPYVSDFTCDYYTPDGTHIDDKNTRFAHDGEVRVKIGFTLSKDAYAAGKTSVTIKFLPSEGFTGRIIEANTSSTVADKLEATFTSDDRQDKQCRAEARLKFDYSSGTLNFGYTYDDGDTGEVGNQPLKCSEAFKFDYDEETNGYTLSRDPDCTEWILNATNLTLPTTFADKPITAIGADTFSDCENLTSITIPATVTSIGNSAFRSCKNLDGITIPSGVTEIGSSAFYGCRSLSGVTIPSGVTSVEKETFYGCESLTSVTIPENIKSIGEYAFGNCTRLNNVTIPTGAATIGNRAFSGCSSLASATIPDTISELGKRAFSGCALTAAAIPSGVTEIPEYLFSDCNSLASVSLHESITSIGDYAFSGCGSLTGVVIPTSVTTIGNYAFSGCAAITEINIPNTVEKIGDKAFWDCANLASVTLHESTTSIGSSAFGKCPIEKAWIPTSAISAIPSASLKFVEITEGGTIGDGTFQNYGSLENVTLDDTVTYIGSKAFENCGNLANITLNGKVTYIGSHAFNNCKNLKSVHVSDLSVWCDINFADYYSNPLCFVGDLYENDTLVTELVIPDGVTKIKNYVFVGCNSITSVKIPDSLNEIGSSAFSGCTGLKSVHIDDLEAWCNINFADYYSNPLSKYYGDTSKDTHNLYLDGKPVTELTIPDGVMAIKDYTFAGCSGITSVSIGNRVTSVGEGAFNDCSGLTKVSVADLSAWCNIDFVNYYSNPLYYAKNLCVDNNLVTELTIPAAVTKIKDYAFSYAVCLTSVTIGDSVTSIGSRAFSGCAGLASITIGKGVSSVSEYAFSGCGNGQLSVYIGDVAKWCNINFAHQLSNPLYYVKNLYVKGNENPITELVIPDGVREIKNYAFRGCRMITGVTIPNSATSIAKSAFEGCYIEKATLPISAISSIPLTRLQDLTITSGGTIEKSALSGCTKLTSVTIGNNATSIGESAFDGFTKLTSVTIGDNVTSIGQSAFNNCTALTNVTWGKKVKTIGNSAFKRCLALTSFTFPEGVTTIGSKVLDGSYNVKEITIPHSVTNIEKLAFYNCGVKTITYTGTEAEWANVCTKIGNLNNPNGRKAVEISVICTSSGTDALKFYLYIDE